MVSALAAVRSLLPIRVPGNPTARIATAQGRQLLSILRSASRLRVTKNFKGRQICCAGRRLTPFSFATERLPCGKRVHVISPANNLSILDGDDGRESVVIRSARFDGFAMNLIFQSDHTAFLGMVNRRPSSLCEINSLRSRPCSSHRGRTERHPAGHGPDPGARKQAHPI